MFTDKFITSESYYDIHKQPFYFNCYRHSGISLLSYHYKHGIHDSKQIETFVYDLLEKEGRELFEYIEMHEFVKKVIQRDNYLNCSIYLCVLVIQ